MRHAAPKGPVQLRPSIQSHKLCTCRLVVHTGSIWQLQNAVLQYLPQHMWRQGLMVVPAEGVCCMCCLNLRWEDADSSTQQL